MNLLQRIAEFVHGALPPTNHGRLEAGFVDACVALMAGARSPEGRALLTLAAQTEAERAGLATAIIRSTEVDDIHLASCTTPSSVAVAVALCDGRPGDPQTVVSAVSVGIELMIRLGLAIDGPNALYRGIWPTCFAAPLGAAATRARLRGLTVDQTMHALSLALMASSGRIGRFAGTPSGRWVLIKTAVANGVQAADAAGVGFKGDPTLLDADWLGTAQGIGADLSKIADKLGEVSMAGALSMKPFSTARQALAPTTALQTLLANGLDPASIRRIQVSVPSAYSRMISQPITPSRSSGYVSAAFQMALAALRPQALWDLERSSVMTDPAILDFAGRITVAAEPAFDAIYPRHWPARIAVETAGRILVHEEEVALGDPDRPLSDTDLVAKHRHLLSFAYAGKAEALRVQMADALQSTAALAATKKRLHEALKKTGNEGEKNAH
ncbi:MmgE/PrpD family protein [Roseiarcaceae bacterium H3SJ34-1]|uniref:MmgE/PrpD family protein n=1 Tax=Terripilifer ovatus TaxID=3032367 RepID=UPI003AB9AC79|nr:MmgE/PrpD family protein [Roseiarcaceae bacterium H3SJ34-1]